MAAPNVLAAPCQVIGLYAVLNSLQHGRDRKCAFPGLGACDQTWPWPVCEWAQRGQGAQTRKHTVGSVNVQGIHLDVRGVATDVLDDAPKLFCCQPVPYLDILRPVWGYARWIVCYPTFECSPGAHRYGDDHATFCCGFVSHSCLCKRIAGGGRNEEPYTIHVGSR